MTAPLVSVIIPTYNRADLLREALASVLSQTFTDWECLVVDDGSTDETSAVVAGTLDDRVQYLTVEHSGNPAVVRNVGMGAARGTLIAFLDDDDLWKPQKLATQIPLLERDGARWSYTGFASADEQGIVNWQTSSERIHSGSVLRALLELRAAIALPTVLVARQLVEAVGGFDEEMKTREDHALWLALAEKADVVATPEILTVVRDHPGRQYRPESYRSSLTLYRKWHDHLEDESLRRVCRDRLVDTHLREAKRRLGARQGQVALHALLESFRCDALRTVRRLSAALGRRIGVRRSSARSQT